MGISMQYNSFQSHYNNHQRQLTDLVVDFLCALLLRHFVLPLVLVLLPSFPFLLCFILITSFLSSSLLVPFLSFCLPSLFFPFLSFFLLFFFLSFFLLSSFLPSFLHCTFITSHSLIPAPGQPSGPHPCYSILGTSVVWL